MSALTVLAIDPGRAKCGVAVVAMGRVLHRAVVPSENLAAAVHVLLELHTPAVVLVGDGTGSAAVAEELRRALPDLKWVDERHTSELARAQYLRDHPPSGWRRLLPRGLRVPDAPYDDYVAVILAERWLAAIEENRAPAG